MTKRVDLDVNHKTNKSFKHCQCDFHEAIRVIMSSLFKERLQLLNYAPLKSIEDESPPVVTVKWAHIVASRVIWAVGKSLACYTALDI